MGVCCLLVIPVSVGGVWCVWVWGVGIVCLSGRGGDVDTFGVVVVCRLWPVMFLEGWRMNLIGVVVLVGFGLYLVLFYRDQVCGWVRLLHTLLGFLVGDVARLRVMFALCVALVVVLVVVGVVVVAISSSFCLSFSSVSFSFSSSFSSVIAPPSFPFVPVIAFSAFATVPVVALSTSSCVPVVTLSATALAPLGWVSPLGGCAL